MAEARTGMNLGRALALFAAGTSRDGEVRTVAPASPVNDPTPRAQSITLATMQGVLAVDVRLWRGPSPTMLQYGELAAAGVELIVDLRTESDLEETARVVESFEMSLMALPTNPTRSPQPAHVEQFVRRHREHRGITYVHANDTGRTAAIVGAYLVHRGANAFDVMSDELATGSLTTSQMAYIAAAGQRPLVVGMLDLVVDRPTQKLRSLRS